MKLENNHEVNLPHINWDKILTIAALWVAASFALCLILRIRTIIVAVELLDVLLLLGLLAFGNDIDYAQLVKIYGSGQNSQGQYRYSPAQCMGTRKAVMTGQPKREHISTSIVERQNLTMRMSIRRFTRLTNAHSKKLENHEHAVALHFFHYNFCRIHQTLRCTPAMQAGITDRVWSLADIADLLDVAERRAA